MNDESATKSGNSDDYSCRITSVKNCPSLRTNLLSPTNIVLDYVKAVHVDLSTRQDKHIWHFSLNGVPKFLVDAFKYLEESNAFRIDGIFRKEGNASRLKNAWTIYCGMSPLPMDCTIHDVCSLIKRFFREIKSPIFDDCQANILKFAESLNNNEETVFKAISAVIERLPAVNATTLTFLLKQLRKVSEYSYENRMTVENLATVFAPSLFRDDTPISKTTKKKKDDQFHIMNFVRSRNNLQISVVKLLISRSHLLCPPREVKLPRHSSEHYAGGSSKKKVILATPSSAIPVSNSICDENTSSGGQTPAQMISTASFLEDSVSIDFDESDFADTPSCKLNLKRSQSAKSSIQRVLSLRERMRNVNYPPNGSQIALRSTSVWHQKPRIVAALADMRNSSLTSRTKTKTSFLSSVNLTGSTASTKKITDSHDKDDLNVDKLSSIDAAGVLQDNGKSVSAAHKLTRPSLPKLIVPLNENKKPENVTTKMARLKQSQMPLQQVQPPYAFRKTRAFVSDYEKICTRCDAHGHLLKECPKASTSSSRPSWK